MKASLVLLAVSASLATAQLVGPECAQPCITAALTNTGSCAQTDIKCICESKSFIEGVGACVLKSCPADAVNQVIEQATKLCQAAGATLDTNIPTATATDTAATSSLVTITTTEAVSSGTALPTPTGNGTTTKNITVPTPTPSDHAGAGSSNVVAGGLTMAGAAIAAFLLL